MNGLGNEMDQEEIFTPDIISESPVGILKMYGTSILLVVEVWVKTGTSAFFDDSTNPQLKTTALEVMERVISNQEV